MTSITKVVFILSGFTFPYKSCYFLNEYCDNIGLKWSYGLSVNKLNHILNGNRRNVGYKYFSWNCDRGLIGKNKIDDIRIFAAKYKPSVKLICEGAKIIKMKTAQMNLVQNRSFKN